MFRITRKNRIFIQRNNWRSD